MSSGTGADALLKGMLGISIAADHPTTNANGSNDAPAEKTNKNKNKNSSKKPYPNKSTAQGPAPSPGARPSSRGKKPARSPAQRRDSNSGSNPGGGDGRDNVEQKKGGGKKKKNKKPNKGGGVNNSSYAAATATATANKNSAPGNNNKDKQLKKMHETSGSKHNANNYAWSAFQSSPDPSALPDIGSLFGDGDDDNNNEGAAKEDLDREKKIGINSSNAGEEEDGAEERRCSPNLGPPSESIRTSLVHSMVAKKGSGSASQGMNAGTALLQRLQTPSGSSAENSPALVASRGGDTRFRTMESLEAEMLSPPKKGSVGDDIGEKETIREDETEAKDPATHKKPEQKSAYDPDPITELMNPGGHPGGYGMQKQPQHQQPQPHNNMQYHQPQQYGHPQHHPHHPPPHHHPMQQHPGYPYGGHNMPPQPHHMHQPPPPYNPYHPPPGYTTVSARVPPVLGPGNTMMVNGMSVPVPEGVPPGAVIPVMVPAMHQPPPHHHQYGGYYQQQQQQQQHQMQQQYHQQMQQQQQQQQMQFPQQQTHQGQQQPEPKVDNSWAAKVKKVTASPMNDTKITAEVDKASTSAAPTTEAPPNSSKKVNEKGARTTDSKGDRKNKTAANNEAPKKFVKKQQPQQNKAGSGIAGRGSGVKNKKKEGGSNE